MHASQLEKLAEKPHAPGTDQFSTAGNFQIVKRSRCRRCSFVHLTRRASIDRHLVS